MQTTEVWKPVPEWEGMYEVSSSGRFRSLPRPGTRGPNTGQVLRGSLKNGRHVAVTLRDSKSGRREVHDLHQLVARTFLPNPEGHSIVRHLDDNARDNSVSNLAWGTQSDNMHDRVRNGNHPSAGITHCKHGHEYTPENTGINSVYKTRFCLTCRKTWQETSRQRKQRKK